MALSREAILSAPVAKSEVFVPEWNDTVFIRALSMANRIKLLDAIYANEAAHTAWKEDQEKPEDEREGVARVDIQDQTILALLFAICDEQGELLFGLGDYDVFASFDYPTIVSLWTALKKHEVRDGEAEKKSSD